MWHLRIKMQFLSIIYRIQQRINYGSRFILYSAMTYISYKFTYIYNIFGIYYIVLQVYI